MTLEEVIGEAYKEYVDGDYVGTLEKHIAQAVRKWIKEQGYLSLEEIVRKIKEVEDELLI